ncbi:MAG TPA: leucyl aminopeptidase [Solirubrobacterales bacterium]|nr:leucyl aminopeptidase [Solirubrobacterales bacterium]
MKIEVRQIKPGEVDADLLVVGLFEDGELSTELAGTAGAADAKGGFEKLALLRPARPARVLVVGLGKREKCDAERLRLAAALAAKEAGKLETASLAWLLPESDDASASAAAIVTGMILADYRFDRFRSSDPSAPSPPRIESLALIGEAGIAAAAEAARICAEAQNRARDLQSLPSNVATPSFLARRAEELASRHDAVSAEVLGREEIAAKAMGGLVAVSQGSAEEPKLIVLRYEGGGEAPTLGFVGKGVTFDTGGISLKPSASMHEMKMDMSGAAAVLEAVGAIAELGLALNLVAVVPSTENMPSGTAIKPGDVITQYNGKTVEVNNTDAEGRLILADALAYAAELGAERIVDLATLTGAVLMALGSTYAAVISNDDDLAAEVERAGRTTGELVWRLPLHPEYKDLTRGTVADLTNASAKRKAGTIYAGSFLEEFVGETPWAHVDIAGTAWDVGRAYTGSDASGFGVRLLVELARELSG